MTKSNNPLDEYMKNAKSTKEKLMINAIILFSKKGYNNVGIRSICSGVGIKESSFYNHYKGKEALFEEIIKYFVESGKRVIFTEDEINTSIEQGDVGYFFKTNMEKFALHTGNPLIHMILQLITMESYTNELAFNISKHHIYYSRKDYTEKVLCGLQKKGTIIDCDIKQVTSEYYYGLKGLLDEYLLYTAWDKDINGIMDKIKNHITFYTDLLRKEP